MGTLLQETNAYPSVAMGLLFMVSKNAMIITKTIMMDVHHSVK